MLILDRYWWRKNVALSVCVCYLVVRRPHEMLKRKQRFAKK